MKVLSASEVEELVEHLAARPDIWLLHQDVWFRVVGPELYALAIKLRNGLPSQMYSLTSKPVAWSPEAVEDYVLWLLEKYTAYATRLEVQDLLRPTAVQGADLDALSRDICELRGEAFTRKYTKERES